jgi:rare lipoprotein A (peptidoglycan hydrolase)
MVKFILIIVFACYSFIIDKTTPFYTATWYDTKPYPKVRRDHSTAAFNLYQKGDKLLVTNLLNKKSDTVEITDRHHCAPTHIDLCKESFSKIANLKDGRIKVLIKKL